MRLASGCLLPAETGAKMRATGGEFDNQRRRRAEETKLDRYTPQKPGVSLPVTPGFAVYGGATTCNLTDSAPIAVVSTFCNILIFPLREFDGRVA